MCCSITAALFMINVLIEASAKSINNLDELETQREFLMKTEEAEAIGGSINLNCDEQFANNILMKMKRNEMDQFLTEPNGYFMSRNFLSYKDYINKSKVYRVIKSMPKGAVLHLHLNLMLNPDDLIEFTYEDNLYICWFNKEKEVKFFYSDNTPNTHCETKWELLSELRSKYKNVGELDDKLKKHLSLDADDVSHNDLNEVWRRFEKRYQSTFSLIAFRPVYEKFYKKGLQRFYDDNILYIEPRTGLHYLYELNGTYHQHQYIVELYERITSEFIAEHPDFGGVKFIVSTSKSQDINKVRTKLEFAVKAKNDYPHLIAGFDLVGQEDVQHELKYYAPLLEEYKSKIDYYLHAGETNWFGTSKDESLAIAILLGTRRIGHGYSMIKHPKLIELIKQRDIAIEVNLISNNVLKLVEDVRNHPLATYFALGLPVVLSSDDPGPWGADPLSHDFYVAFMGVLSGNADIKALKQLALNSIKYSAMDEQMKTRAYNIFDLKWKKFIKHLIEIG